MAFTDVFNGGKITVKAIDVADDGSRLAAVGNFRNVNGHQRTQMAVFDTSTPTATLAPGPQTCSTTSARASSTPTCVT